MWQLSQCAHGRKLRGNAMVHGTVVLHADWCWHAALQWLRRGRARVGRITTNGTMIDGFDGAVCADYQQDQTNNTHDNFMSAANIVASGPDPHPGPRSDPGPHRDPIGNTSWAECMMAECNAGPSRNVPATPDGIR